MQGIGVSTPNAAAVAAATVGFAIDMHIPNGMMFIIEMWSMMFCIRHLIRERHLIGRRRRQHHQHCIGM